MGLWNGKRDGAFIVRRPQRERQEEKDNDPRIPFTVRVLQDQSPPVKSRLLHVYEVEMDRDTATWKLNSRRNDGSLLYEDDIDGYKRKLIREWARLSERWSGLSQSNEPLKEEMDDVNWTEIAEGLKLGEVKGYNGLDSLMNAIKADAVLE